MHGILYLENLGGVQFKKNTLYEAGFLNDKLPLLFLENRNAQVAVKTSGGISNRVNIKKIIMQGSVWGSLCCVALMDKPGKLAYKNPQLVYMYKVVVACPSLQMVDDILGVQNTSYIKVQSARKGQHQSPGAAIVNMYI